MYTIKRTTEFIIFTPVLLSCEGGNSAENQAGKFKINVLC